MAGEWKIEGNGETIEVAERGLASERKGLLKKLGATASTDADLKVARTEYRVAYNLKNTGKGRDAKVNVEAESEESWKEAIDLAQRRIHVADYNPAFTVAQYIHLTKAQKDALDAKPPVASRLDDRAGSLDTYRMLR